MEKALIIGGYGFFGSHVYKALNGEYSLEVMSRYKHNNTMVQGKDWIEGDITSSADVERAIGRGYDYIFDFVGLINEKEQKHRMVNISGTQNIISGINASGTSPRVIYISAINAETGNTSYFSSKREAENIISKYEKHTIIRPSIIYGENDFLTQQFFAMLGKNIPILPKSGPLCPVFINDIVDIVKLLMHKDGTFNVCSKEKLGFSDMFNIFRSHFGKKPVKQAPLGLFKLMSPILEATGMITSEQIKMLSYDFCRSDSVLNSLVKTPKTYSNFVSELKQNK